MTQVASRRRDRLVKVMRSEIHARRKACHLGLGDGMGKRGYTSPGAAKRAAAEFAERYSKPMREYRCVCGQWHLTSMVPK